VHAAAWKETFDGFLREWSRQTGEQLVPFDSDYGDYVDGKPRADGTRSFLALRAFTCPRAAKTIPRMRRPCTG
jgi:hypothetical protein